MTLNAPAALALDLAATREERRTHELRASIIEQEERLAATRADLAMAEARVIALRNPTAPEHANGSTGQ